MKTKEDKPGKPGKAKKPVARFIDVTGLILPNNGGTAKHKNFCEGGIYHDSKS